MSEDKVLPLKKYVDDKIMRYTFRAKNFDQVEMDRVDDYCKLHFGNDRKKMILTLISQAEGNLLYNMLNDKIDLLGANMVNQLDNIYKELDINNNKETPVEKKSSWKGFSKD